MSTIVADPQRGLDAAVAARPTLADIYRDYAAFVWRTLRRLGVREADVADVCQEVFVVVHRRLHDYDGRSTVRTWLFGIAMRTASDYRNLARVRREAIGEPIPDEGVPADQLDELERRRARAELDALLDDLDEDKRTVFILYELEQMSMAEVAAAVSCPVQTAYSRLHSARKSLESAVARLQARGRR